MMHKIMGFVLSLPRYVATVRFEFLIIWLFVIAEVEHDKILTELQDLIISGK